MYVNFVKYAVQFEPDQLTFSIFSSDKDTGTFVDGGVICLETPDHRPLSVKDFASFQDESKLETESAFWKRTFSGGPAEVPEAAVGFRLYANRVQILCSGNVCMRTRGHFRFGADPEHATFSIRTDAKPPVLRTASGPATFPGDNALFDRLTDRLLLCLTEGELRTSFDWNAETYAFRCFCGADRCKSLMFEIRRNFCAVKFNIPYVPISKKHGFQTPPVGWMTWYAVKFSASEDVVLENARKFKEKFGGYVQNPVLWVDWEWCHGSLDGLGEDGCDIFHPRPAAYPNGLKAVSDQLRELGFIPALWVGATNEGRQNKMLESHPDWVLGRHRLWCGQWWADPTHPDVLREYIPAIFRQIREWGYNVVKWDCLHDSLPIYSKLHDSFHNPSLTPFEALCNVIKAGRKELGDDVYMLFCAAVYDCGICAAAGSFSAARIGFDIFTWNEFLDQGINRVLRDYPWHNTLLYIDADNLVLRPEHSNFEQARTRVSFYGLAGLPVTLGDALSSLDDARIDMLRRIMPVADIHPTELESKQHGPSIQITNLAIARPFGQWTVAGITNLTSSAQKTVIGLQADLDLAPGRYAVYDYWDHHFLGVFDEQFCAELNPFDTKVFRITPLQDHIPALVSVSRHLTQGGYELTDLTATERAISGHMRCIPEEPCTLTILLPEGCGKIRSEQPFSRKGDLVEITLCSPTAAEVNWSLLVGE